jgi:hypothetical protein
MRANTRFALLVSVAILLATAGCSQSEPDGDNGADLPVPNSHVVHMEYTTSGIDMQKPFLHELKGTVSQPLSDVLAFYRRALGKRGWQEVDQQASTGNVAADSAVLHFTRLEGLAVLYLTRADGATHVDLVTHDPDAATKAGVMPKAGQAMVIFGNNSRAPETITFNNQPINVPVSLPNSGPEPSLDLPPGIYQYSVHLADKPVQTEQIELHADETWELMIVPDDVSRMHLY